MNSSNELDESIVLQTELCAISDSCYGDTVECLHGNTRAEDNIFERTNLGSSTLILKKQCWFYVNYGYCRYGRYCKFNHPARKKTKKKTLVKNFDMRSAVPEKNQAALPHSDISLSKEQCESNVLVEEQADNRSSSLYPAKMYQFRRVCRFFKEGICRKGDNCAFRHPLDNKNQTDEQKAESYKLGNCPEVLIPKDESTAKIPSTLTTENAKHSLCLKQLNEEDLHHLRETEIKQLKKRYPNFKSAQINSTDTFQFVFYPSDPDWAFIVKSVLLDVTFTEFYPKEACEIKVLDDKVFMPSLLLSFLNGCIKDWLTEKHDTCAAAGKVELVLRTFLRWLDRNLEQLFISGLKKVKLDVDAKKAGIEFVPYEMLPGASIASTPSCLLEESSTVQVEHLLKNTVSVDELRLAENTVKHECIHDQSVQTSNDENLCSENVKFPGKTVLPKRGTEIKFINFELKDSAAALNCQKIALSVQCCRCKTRHEIVTPAKQSNILSCTKCHQAMEITFHSALLHPHSSVLGYLHLLDCSILDIALMECQFVIDCLNCCKQNSAKGIHYGQSYVTWCLFCNQKLSILASSVKFQQLLPPTKIGTTAVRQCTSEKKIKKDTVIAEGQPLPNLGICKHYKKSHRWLRFPCCGKSYPCDICHDENEVGHEMKYANRMICGFCAKEQPYSKDKPCVSCLFSMIKKPGPHWEGGKGCRDRIRMSRDDKQKYSGASKTISRKSKEQKNGK